jgi:glycosyltransferase involved in cell wall biosynthesis
VLVDRETVGHHFLYVTRIAQSLVELGHRVTVVYPDVDRLRRWFAEALPHSGAAIRLRTWLDPAEPRPGSSKYEQAWRVLKIWRLLGDHVRKAQREFGPARLTLYASLDSMLEPAKYRFWHPLMRLWEPRPAAGLLIGCVDLVETAATRAPAYKCSLGHRLEFLATSACRTLAVLTPRNRDLLRSRLPGARVNLLPDFTDDTIDPTAELARQVRERAGRRKVVTMTGVLNRRKGIDRFLRVIREASEERLFFVIAGELHLEGFSPAERRVMQDQIEAGAAHALFKTERLPDEGAFNALIQASDVIYAVYPGYQESSNLVVKAARFGKPVLVADDAYVAADVIDHGLGGAADAGSTISLLRAISDLALRNDAVNVDGAAAYLAQHSADKLRGVLAELIEAAAPSLKASRASES